MEELKPAATGSENATQEQGYLMAYDKKEQKAKGVKGIAANGELETLEANETNKSQFIRVDRYGNFFTNFGKNFMYQYNHPTRYALYRMEEKTPVEEAKRRIEQAQLPENESLRREITESTTTTFSMSARSTGSRPSVTGLPQTCSDRQATWKGCYRADTPA